MTFDESDLQRGESRIRSRQDVGWTSLHSWVFLGIIAAGLVLLVMQNRYHYLNPQGLGKAYRIDKLSGSIQEFDPSDGWIMARLLQAPPAQMSGMAPPPMVGSQAMPMHMLPAQPGEAMTPSAPAPAEKPAVAAVPERPTKPAAKESPQEKSEMSQEERLRSFLKAFPDFGREEFQLANDDLYPDWKRNMAPQGTWPEFLKVYGAFIDWWQKAGSPAESGTKLWKDFTATQKQR
ncbi:MAG: hypothetical protein LDL33_07770 [Desulfomonile sp.]|nr:hypothetical protein [Desulfomonile sp.]